MRSVNQMTLFDPYKLRWDETTQLTSLRIWGQKEIPGKVVCHKMCKILFGIFKNVLLTCEVGWGSVSNNWRCHWTKFLEMFVISWTTKVFVFFEIFFFFLKSCQSKQKILALCLTMKIDPIRDCRRSHFLEETFSNPVRPKIAENFQDFIK